MATDLSKEERKAKREARRQKQREQNIYRAQKMHQERLEHLPLALPAGTLGKNIYVGCSGWFYWHWKDAFYAGLPNGEWFNHYSKHFSTVELNAPFYSWPTVATVKSWIKQTGRKQFVYTVKVSELITHTKRFESTKTLVQDFGYIADLLGPRMGCFLFQLPPSFTYTATRLKSILSQLDHTRRNVVEFRHKSWWNETVYKAFRKTGTIFCSCSGPRLPDELICTAEEIYIRFHGTKRWYLHDYSKDELEVWAKRIQSSNAKRVWVYFNNDRNGYSIKNAQTFTRQLKVSKL